MQCCLPTFSPNPHLEKEASQHLPYWKLTESDSSGLVMDPSFSQIHPDLVKTNIQQQLTQGLQQEKQRAGRARLRLRSPVSQGS